MKRTLTIKEVKDPSGDHQVGIQLAFFTDDTPFCKLEIPSTIYGGISLETASMIQAFLNRLLPPELR